MVDIEKVERFASILARAADWREGATNELKMQGELFEGGNWLGYDKHPKNPGVNLDFNAAVFQKYVNPVLDKHGIEAVNVNVTVSPQMQVQITADNPQFQKDPAVTKLAQAMSNVLRNAQSSGRIPSIPSATGWQWLVNYG
jgi:hypothetical protein